MQNLFPEKKLFFLHLARTFFGFVTAVYAYNFVDFYYANLNFTTLGHSLLVFLSGLLILLGFVNRFVYALVLLFCWLYVGNATVEQALFTNLAFWFFIINVPGIKLGHKIYFKKFLGSPILLWLPVLNDAFYHFLSAVQKFSDITWIYGYGMFGTFNLPWMSAIPKSIYINLPLYLQLFINYGAMFLQLLILPLMLFRVTTPISIVFIAIFYIALIYPARLDMIGWLGLIYCFFALASEYKGGINLYTNFRKKQT